MGDSEYIAIQFAALLDARLGLATDAETDHEALSLGSEVIEDMEFALSLWPADFPEQAAAKQDVRVRLSRRLSKYAIDTAGPQVPRRPALGLLRSLAALRWRLVQTAVGMALVLILLQAFQVPVLASLQRFVGYGYAPRAGFVPLEGTMLLPRPIVLDEEGGGVEIEQIVLTNSTLEFWTVSQSGGPAPDIAEISLQAGENPDRVDGYRPEVSGGRHYSYWSFRGAFLSSPWLEIRLEGFESRRIPLQPAAEVLAPLRGFRVCDTHSGISVCAVSLMVAPESTCALVEIHLQDHELVDGLPWLVGHPILPRRDISIRTSDGAMATGIPHGFPIAPMKVSGETGTFLEQLCFPVQAAQGEVLLEIPAVEVTVPVTSNLRVPVVSQQEGWVDVGETFVWAGTEITFERARAFPAMTETTILRVLGRQNPSERDPIITAFQLDVRGQSGVSLSGTSHEPRDPHDARTGLHMIDLWLTNERVETGPSYLTIKIGHPHLTYVGPFELRLIR